MESCPKLASLIKEVNFLSLMSGCQKSNVPSSIVYSAIGAESLNPQRVTTLNNSSQQLNHLLSAWADGAFPLKK